MAAVADRVAQHLHPPHPARHIDAAVDQGDAGRVVPAVLEPLETGQQQLLALPVAHISDDSTHMAWLRSDLGFDEAREVPADALALGLILGLDHDPHQRLRTGRAEHDATVISKLLAQSLHLLPDAVRGR